MRHKVECWTKVKELERKLEVIETQFLRKIMIISWTEKVREGRVRSKEEGEEESEKEGEGEIEGEIERDRESGGE